MNLAFEHLDLGFREIFSGERSAETVFADIVRQISAKDRIIHVNGNLKLTKSGRHPTHAFLLRDFELERSVIWANIFRENIFRCWNTTFDFKSRVELFQTLPSNLERTIFLAAIFHEIGHRTGHFKVSPANNPGLKISQFQLDVLGELATDSQLVLNLPEFPEIAHSPKV